MLKDQQVTIEFSATSLEQAAKRENAVCVVVCLDPRQRDSADYARFELSPVDAERLLERCLGGQPLLFSEEKTNDAKS